MGEPQMNAQELIDTARALVADDKGLLALDERNPTGNKRFTRLGIPQTEEARRTYRELPPSWAPRRIQRRDEEKEMSLTTSILQRTKPPA
jgi:Fructose-bisphosphate aldolase class-I